MTSAFIIANRFFVPVAVYVLLGVVGLSLAVPPGYVSPMFPAAGLALALALARGSNGVVLVWAGSFVTNVGLAAFHSGLDAKGIVVAACVGAGASLQAQLGATLIRRRIGDAWQRMEQDREILLLLALGGPVACVVSASVGILAMTMAGYVVSDDAMFAWWSWWTGDALGVLIATPLSILFLHSEDHAADRRRLLSLPIALTLALVFAAFMAVSDWEESRLRNQIGDRADVIASGLQGRFDALSQALAALRRLVEVSPGLTPEQFSHFTRRTLDDRVEVAALSVNPLVPGDERTGFELAQGRSLGIADFRITERDPQRKLVPAATRDTYVPVAMIEPMDENRAALGFDIASNPVRADAVARAKSSGLPAATAVIQLVQASRQVAGVLVLHPVFQIGGDAMPEGMTGFVAAAFKVESLMASTLNPAPSDLTVRIEDVAAEPARRVVFEQPGSGKALASLAERSILHLADRTWTLTLEPTDRYLQEHRTWAAWAVGVAGILFATVLQVLMLVSSGRSVTIARKVEEQTAELRIKSDALEEVLGEHDALIRRIPVGVFKLRLRRQGEYGFDFASPTYCAQLGVAVDDVLADPRVALDRIHPEDREDFRGSQRKARRDFSVYVWEGRVLRGDEIRWIRLQSTPTRLDDGDIVWEGVQEDVTLRVAAEQGQQLLSTAVEQSSASVVITDRAGEIVFVNDAFVRVTRFSREEVLGRNPRILQSGNTAISVYRELWETIIGGGTWQGELQNKTKLGQIYWELATISPVIDAHGRITHFIAIKEDITDKRRQEADLRTAKEEAEAANLARSRFLGNISHEVRTPMNGILGMAQLLRMPGSSEAERREYADSILASGNALRAMLDDILRLSEIESGKLELMPLRFDGAGLLRDAVATYEGPAAHKGLALAGQWDGPAVAYQGDAQRLRQMLVILLGNAVKYTSVGAIRVRGEETSREGSMAMLRFSVRDTGTGISAGHAERVFHSPLQLAYDAEGGAKGGLGLPLVHRLARLMQGNVRVDSEPGRGSCFWFEVRVQVVDALITSAESRTQVVAAVPGGAPRSALLVSVDIGDLRRRFGGDRELMKFAIDAFLDDLPTLTGALETAFAAGNADQIKASAVSMSGAARAVSAAELIALAQAVIDASSDSGESLRRTFASLPDAVARAKEALIALRSAE